jgi:hypothetical protein
LDDISATLIGAFVGVAGAFILTYVRDIYLYSRRTKAQERRAIVQRRLEKLYSPLYRFVKSSEFILKKQTITFSIPAGKDDSTSREKNFLDSTIERYLYLADDDLMALLPRIHGVGYYQKENAQINEQVVKLITSGYEKLRREYFALGS